MNEFLKMDIFFFVTTVVVVVAGILLCLALYYIVRILRNAEKVSEEIEAETRAVREDIDELRQSVRSEGLGLSHVLKFAGKSFMRFFKPKKHSK